MIPYDGTDPFPGRDWRLDSESLRPDPLRLSAWALIALGSLLLCSGLAAWWAVWVVIDAVRFVASLP